MNFWVGNLVFQTISQNYQCIAWQILFGKREKEKEKERKKKKEREKKGNCKYKLLKIKK